MNSQPYPNYLRSSRGRGLLLHILVPLCAAVIAALCIVPASAQTPNSDEARLQQIERQIASLQAEVQATRSRMSTQSGSGVLPPAEGTHIDGKDYKSPVIPEPVEAARWRFFVGADALVVQPRWTINPAYVIKEGGQFQSHTQKNFDHDFTVSPVIRAGVVSPGGLGFRGSYWWMNSDANKHVTSVEDDGQELHTAYPLGQGFDSDDDDDNFNWSIHSSLDLNHVIDGEVTYPAKIGNIGILFSGGVRYVDMDQSYDVDRVNTEDDDDFGQVDSVRSGHDFQGAGPTVAAEATYTFGSSGFGLYSSGRGSILFGERDQWASRIIDVGDPNFTRDVRTSQDSSLTIGEVEGGLSWTHDWSRWGINLRAGVVGQAWLDAGNAANSENILGTSEPDQASDPGADLGLLGFRFSAGVHF